MFWYDLDRALGKALLLFALLAQGAAPAIASTGYTVLAATQQDGPVTVLYPSDSAPSALDRGEFHFSLARDGATVAGNGRLVVISHGSGGSPWVGMDLAESLVTLGFVVAMPEHQGDNFKDTSDPGPDSWTKRPGEVSRAIDRVAADARFHDALKVDRVGVYGISAGGHTALELAGASWSPARFAEHCQVSTQLREDFNACVGLMTALKGNIFDGAKLWLAEHVIRHRFSDDTARHARDPRIAVAVAAVPFAADFDMDTFRHLDVPIGMVVSSNDTWLAPRFHDLAVLAGCNTCSVIARLDPAGHGAMLSPHPDHLSGLEGALLKDPPGFDRSQIPAVNQKVADFLAAHLLS
jgi:predicted dienelactone hydrolase